MKGKIIAAFAAAVVFAVSFVLLSKGMAVRPPQEGKQKPSVTPANPLPETSGAFWSVWAITDGDTISDCYLRYADFYRDTLVFVHVPVTTSFELTAGGFELMKSFRPEMPKIFRLSGLYALAPEKTFCVAAEEVFSEVLGKRPRECFVMERAEFEKYFEMAPEGPIFRANTDIRQQIAAMYSEAICDRDVREGILYTESYLDVKEILFCELPGSGGPGEFRPDYEKIRLLAENLENGFYEGGTGR